MHINRDMVELVLTIVTGVGVVLQAAVLFGILMAFRQTQKRVMGLAERLEEVITPLISSTRGVVEDISPKIKVITTNLVGASETLRKQSEHVSSVVHDVAERTKHQTVRVDGLITQQTSRVNSIVTGALDSLGEATAAVERGIAAPLRQVNGVLAGLKAGLETLRTGQTAPIRKPVPPASAAPVSRPPVAPVPPAPSPSYVASTPAAPAYSQSVEPIDVTPEEAREAAARFVRDRAASERR